MHPQLRRTARNISLPTYIWDELDRRSIAEDRRVGDVLRVILKQELRLPEPGPTD